MAPFNGVKIQEVCPVAPPEPRAQRTFPLTYFDAAWLRFPPTQRLFFYETTFDSFSDSILPKLKHSLSLALRHFLPLAGTLVWPPPSAEPFIRTHSDSALHLTVAESDADFHRLSGNDFRESAEYHPLVPHLPASEAEARVAALQVTFFPGSGFSIGIAYHHAALDGRAAALFLKAWASVCKLGGGGGAALPPELTPFHDRTVIEDPKGIKQKYLDRWRLKEDGPNNRSLMFVDKPININAPSDTILIRGNFTLRVDDVMKLRERIGRKKEKKEEEEVPRLSTFVLTCAYLWVCLAKAEGLESNDVCAHFLFSADCRGRLEPPIPATYFGNCVGPGFASAKVGDLTGEDGVAVAAEALGEGVRSLNNGGIYGKVEEWSAGSQFPDEISAKTFTVAGSPQFELYATDFGWGRPRKIEVVSVDGTGAVALSESRDGRSGGVEIGLALARAKMEVFASVFAEGLRALKS